MIVDAWMQHPTRRFLENEMFASLRRWSKAEAEIPADEIPIEASVAAMTSSVERANETWLGATTGSA